MAGGALHGTNWPALFLRLQAAAAEAFTAWDVELRNRLRFGGDDGALAAHLGKYPKAVCGLALLAHLADGGTGDISETAVLRALAWSEFLGNLGAAMSEGGKKSSKIRVAVECMVDAGRCRGDAAACGGPEADDNLAYAQALERAAGELRIPKKAPIIRSGEVIATADENDPPWEIADTLRNPDQVAIEASATRTRLLLDQPDEMVALAVDMAESLRAENSAEKMLAHQLATLHVLMMKVSKRALDFGRCNNGSHGQFTQEQSVELSRHCNTAATAPSRSQ